MGRCGGGSTDRSKTKELLRQVRETNQFQRNIPRFGTHLYLYVRKLVTASNSEEWTDESVVKNEQNLWDQKAKEGKAVRNFALANRMTVASVSLQQVSDSAAGIDGWSEAQVSIGSQGIYKYPMELITW